MNGDHPTRAFGRGARGLLLAAAMATSLFSMLPAWAQTPAKPAPGKTVEVKTQRDPWQVRRSETLRLISLLSNKATPKAESEKAYQAFDAILTRFDKNPLEFTPMEGMDLMQVYYIPKEEQYAVQLSILAFLATSGWYDALRFGDESGRAEIVNNEEFFKRALMAKRDGFIAFMEQQPQEAAKAVADGISWAFASSESNFYDRRWPASYGLLRMQCALAGSSSCQGPKPMAQDQWPQAFDEAAARVTRYYRINKN